MKFLYPNINWDEIKVIGFDLDGTLYDEYDFIKQVYIPISKIIAAETNESWQGVYSYLLEIWLSKGSSYNRIFEEFLALKKISEKDKKITINKCIEVYRTYRPKLKISSRVEKILELFSRNYMMFLITDGNEKLQSAKIESLNLKRWFNIENIMISGSSISNISKPNKSLTNSIHALQDKKIMPHNIIYFGDRDVDEKFAKNCGFHYQEVRTMQFTSK
jgi:putative hydrolase of the HAD superfamily